MTHLAAPRPNHIRRSLQQVGHPLLPSQAVHGPVLKLVAAAGTQVRRVEGAGGGGGGGGREEGTAAGVQANLARLLGEIWRKLREESALLDFFLRADGGDGDLRLDVFDRLLPLLEQRGGAGQQAQEACLVALSVQDERVGRYVRDRTEFASQLAETLTARYLALYDTLEELQVAAALPPAAGAGKGDAGAAGVAGLLTQQQPERAEATFTEALALFLQHLRFCNAVGLVAADTQACLRPPSRLPVSSPGGGGGGGTDAGAVVQTGIFTVQYLVLACDCSYYCPLCLAIFSRLSSWFRILPPPQGMSVLSTFSGHCIPMVYLLHIVLSSLKFRWWLRVLSVSCPSFA